MRAKELTRIVPPGLVKFHFSDNGSAAVECSLKMAFPYYFQTRKQKKKRFMCLSGGYHGETIGVPSVGSIDLYVKMYKPILMDAIHINAPDCYRCPYGKMRETCNCECFVNMEQALYLKRLRVFVMPMMYF